MKFSSGIVALLLTSFVLSCNKVPDSIIHPDEMSEIMADIHMGEAVIDVNYKDYMTDSTRMLMKQSILAKHGFTTTDLDTSLAWYGGHLDLMHEIYEQTNEILERRASEGDPDMLPLNGEMTADIDSTDVWTGYKYYIIRQNLPSSVLTFSIDGNDEWKPGDSFTLRGYFTNNNSPTDFIMMAEYSDGSIESITTKFSGMGIHLLTIHTDSTKTTSRLSGSIKFDLSNAKAIIVDSLSLIKKPLDVKTYTQRYRQRKEKFFNRNMKQAPDSVAL